MCAAIDAEGDIMIAHDTTHHLELFDATEPEAWLASWWDPALCDVERYHPAVLTEIMNLHYKAQQALDESLLSGQSHTVFKQMRDKMVQEYVDKLFMVNTSSSNRDASALKRRWCAKQFKAKRGGTCWCAKAHQPSPFFFTHEADAELFKRQFG